MPSPMHVLEQSVQRKAPLRQTQGKVSLTKGDYKAVRWLEGAWEKRGGEREVGRGKAGPDPGAWYPP